MTLLSTSTGTVHPVVNDTSDLTQDMTVQGALTLDGNVTNGADINQNLLMTAGKTLTVAANATLTTQHDNWIESTSCCTNEARVVNNGTIEAKDRLTIDGVALDQNNLLNAETAASEVVSLAGDHTAGTGARYTGAGSYRLTEASASGTLSGTQTLDSGFRFILGGDATTSNSPADGNESLHGTFTFAGTGQLQWAGGHLSANMTIAHTATALVSGNVVGDARHLDGQDAPVNGGGITVAATFTNHGTMTFADAPTVGDTDNGRLVNSSDGTPSIGPGSTFRSNCCNTYGAVVNSGGAVTVPVGSSSAPRRPSTVSATAAPGVPPRSRRGGPFVSKPARRRCWPRPPSAAAASSMWPRR